MGGGPRINRKVYIGGGSGGGAIAVSTGSGEQRILMYQRYGTTYTMDSGLHYSSSAAQTILQQKLQRGSGELAQSSIAAIIPIISAVHPLLGFLYLVAQIVYPVVKTGLLAYALTLDSEKTFMAMFKESVKQVAVQMISVLISLGTSSAMNFVKDRLNVQISNKGYQVIENFISAETTDFVLS